MSRYADLELVRRAVPRRLYTLSHVEYVVDRVTWLFQHRKLIKGLRFVEEPKVLRFFFGKLAPLEGWSAELARTFEGDFGAGC